MTRTNVDIDDDLLRRVMDRYRFTTKREAVNEALRRLAGEALTRDEALAMEGVGWDGDVGAMRDGRAIEEL